jgi:hypothetical protein
MLHRAADSDGFFGMTCSMHGEKRNAKGFGGKPGVKRPLRRPRYKR